MISDKLESQLSQEEDFICSSVQSSIEEMKHIEDAQNIIEQVQGQIINIRNKNEFGADQKLKPLL